MKRRFWIGGVLLLMIFTGMTGCGGPKEPPPERRVNSRWKALRGTSSIEVVGFVIIVSWF